MATERSILLAADHAGYALKSEFLTHLLDLGWTPQDNLPHLWARRGLG